MATRARAWQRVTRNDQLLLFFLAVLVGTAAGYGALLFRLVTGTVARSSRAPPQRCRGGMSSWP